MSTQPTEVSQDLDGPPGQAGAAEGALTEPGRVPIAAATPEPPGPRSHRPTLHLRSLRIEHMPGIPLGGGFELGGLSPGVTVVHGPNGSGKSTTARAIERLLWPAAFAPRPAERGRERSPAARTVRLAAEWWIDGAAWTIELEGRMAHWRRDGAVAAAPDVGPAELRHRYRLALADLLAATDADDLFAAAVQRAMAGGFDLALVRDELGALQRPSGRRAEANALRSALQHLRDAQGRADALERDRTEVLPQLERELTAARDIAARSDAVATALRRLDAEEELALARQALALLPVDRLRRCRADDEATLRELDERLEAAQQAVQAAQETLSQAASRLRGRPLGEEHAADAGALDASAMELERVTQRRADLESALAGQRQTRDRALRPLAARGATPPAPELVAQALASLGEDQDATRTAAEGHRLRARREAVEAQRQLLMKRDEAERIAGGAEALRQTRRDLADWLATGPQAPLDRPPWLTLAALAVAALLAFCLAVLHHLAWLLLLPALAGLAWLSTRLPFDAGSAERRTLRERIERSGTPPPEAWSIDGVTARLRDLESQIAGAAMAERAVASHQELDVRTRSLSEAEARHRTAIRTIEDRFGAAMPADEAWLPVLASSLASWQRSHQEVVRLEAEVAALDRLASQLVGGAMARVAALGLGEVPAAPQGGSGLEPRLAAAAMRRIAQELREMMQSAREAQRAGRALQERLNPAEAKARAARDRFFTDRGLAPGDVAGLRALLEQLPELERRQRSMQRAMGAMEGATPAPDLPRSRPELASLRSACADAQARVESLNERIGAVRQALAHAERGADVADAKAAVDAARGRLAALREQERAAATVDVLLRHLDARTRERSLPEVFARANALLGRLTHGRFALRLSADDHRASFRVHDAVAAIEKSLEDLSSGERVQLLCAVRLAFIEHEERRAVPLVVDEALGTSDDLRASALMDALIDAARRGRQVICFTAQLDEVARWQARLEQAQDVPHAIVDLGAIRRMQAASGSPLPTPRPVLAPPPAGCDHASYGKLLGVPGLDPLLQEAHQVHLWHALADVDLLHRLLDSGFATIGQVLHYQAATGQPPPGSSTSDLAAVAAAQRGLERLFECWRRGRCRPITAAELLATGVVTATFEERVRTLLEELRGDGTALLAALEAGRVRNWRSASTEELRDALVARGLLPVGTAMDDRSIELEVRAHLHDALRDGVLPREWPALAVSRVACGSTSSSHLPES